MDQYTMIAERIIRSMDSNYLKVDRWDIFRNRMVSKLPELYPLILELYGDQYDVHIFLEKLLRDIWEAFQVRPAWLLAHDLEKAGTERWFLSNKAVGAVYYLDLFAGSFLGLIEKIGYLKSLGITYLHLMPIYRTAAGEHDGGYAVADYHTFQEGHGSAEDLAELANALKEAGIHLSLDMVLNHTSNRHAWAQKAIEGDRYYRNFYYIFDRYEEVAPYQKNLRDIFPEVRKGSFTWVPEVRGWVWTTFNSFQWDLKYRNHEVFRSMVGEILFLANCGADVFRFDAVAFMWKKQGTRCESLPKVHTLIKAMKLAVSLLIPTIAFKSEAIVHPEEVLGYIHADECEISYNPLLMAASWEALATRNPALLRKSIEHWLSLPGGCAWINYVRCHDDIGWTFDDGDAAELGINGYDHRKFLNSFYTGSFSGSFSRGLPFQENRETGDCRLSGSCASLAGLEAALEKEEPSAEELEFSLRRIKLLYGLSASVGGVPLLYLGDELGVLNDYSYREVIGHREDSRWVHRPPFDWDRLSRAEAGEGVEARVLQEMRNLFTVRAEEPALSMGKCRMVDGGHRHILGFARSGPAYDLLVLANFSDGEEFFDEGRLFSDAQQRKFVDLLTGRQYEGKLALQPWELLWLKPLV